MSDSEPKNADQRVGELAAATGVTVRTLHHYDEIGLLVPSGRSSAGHRLYSQADVERLYRITLLQRLGLSLSEIANALDPSEPNLAPVLDRHLRTLDERLSAGARIRNRLSLLVDRSPTQTHLSTNDLIEVMEDIAMFESNVKSRISILVFRDLEASSEYLSRVFGLEPVSIDRDPSGNPVHAALQAGDGVIWLHPESPEFGLASPRSVGASTATMAIMVDDVDAHHAHAVANGADVVYPPVDQPYGYREYSARDLEGGLWSFMKPC